MNEYLKLILRSDPQPEFLNVRSDCQFFRNFEDDGDSARKTIPSTAKTCQNIASLDFKILKESEEEHITAGK